MNISEIEPELIASRAKIKQLVINIKRDLTALKEAATIHYVLLDEYKSIVGNQFIFTLSPLLNQNPKDIKRDYTKYKYLLKIKTINAFVLCSLGILTNKKKKKQ